MTIEPTLFGEVCLTRRWGRIGAHGQTMQHTFAQEREAVRLFLELLRQKLGRGVSSSEQSGQTDPTLVGGRIRDRLLSFADAADSAVP